MICRSHEAVRGVAFCCNLYFFSIFIRDNSVLGHGHKRRNETNAKITKHTSVLSQNAGLTTSHRQLRYRKQEINQLSEDVDILLVCLQLCMDLLRSWKTCCS